MGVSDLAVCAAGVTSLELACIGAPMMCVVLTDNQVRGAEAVEEKGIGVSLGRIEHWDETRFRECHQKLAEFEVRKAMSLQGRALVDGLGAQRLAEALEKL